MWGFSDFQRMFVASSLLVALYLGPVVGEPGVRSSVTSLSEINEWDCDTIPGPFQVMKFRDGSLNKDEYQNTWFTFTYLDLGKEGGPGWSNLYQMDQGFKGTRKIQSKQWLGPGESDTFIKPMAKVDSRSVGTSVNGAIMHNNIAYAVFDKSQPKLCAFDQANIFCVLDLNFEGLPWIELAANRALEGSCLEYDPRFCAIGIEPGSGCAGYETLTCPYGDGPADGADDSSESWSQIGEWTPGLDAGDGDIFTPEISGGWASAAAVIDDHVFLGKGTIEMHITGLGTETPTLVQGSHLKSRQMNDEGTYADFTAIREKSRDSFIKDFNTERDAFIMAINRENVLLVVRLDENDSIGMHARIQLNPLTKEGIPRPENAWGAAWTFNQGTSPRVLFGSNAGDGYGSFYLAW